MKTRGAGRHHTSWYRTLVLLVVAATGGLALMSPGPAVPDGRGHQQHDDRAEYAERGEYDDERADRPPTIQWSPGRVKETVARGARKTAQVSFSSTRDLTDVAVSIGGELAPYVTAYPSSLPSIAAGTTTTIILTFSAPVDARTRALEGALRLRASGSPKRTYARPLPVRLRVTHGHPPIADAGPDQTSGVLVGDAVLLDGSASTDPDGQTLSYSWALIAAPADSTATLSDPTLAALVFAPDKPGTYTARLTVNDGVMDSAPDDVSVTVVVPPPTVGIATPENLSVLAASPVAVTGTVDDPDASVTVNGHPVVNDAGSFAVEVALAEGSNTITVIAQNGTGQGSANVEVILNTTDNPVLTITSPVAGFLAGEEFAMGAPLHAARVAVTGVIKVNTRAPLPIASLNKPTVTVNGVEADVSLNFFFSGCGLLNPFQCWRFAATIPLEQGERTITAVGTDVAKRSTAASVQGVVDYCRIGEFNAHAPTSGSDPGVTALAGVNHDIQSNRCHEIDGCSAPVVSQECADDPMMCPLGRAAFLWLRFVGLIIAPPVQFNTGPTAFGRGANPPTEYFVHGLQSAHDLPCNRHDTCYQTCVRVTGLSALERDQAWEAEWRRCNQRQFDAMRTVCRNAYPEKCPYTVLGLPDPFRCPLWASEKTTCYALAQGYFAAVGSVDSPLPGGISGFDRFKQRQMDYCVVP